MRFTRTGLLATALLLGACSGDMTEDSMLEPQLNSVSEQYVRVYKFGPAGTYEFDVAATGGIQDNTHFSIAAGTFQVVWGSGPFGTPASVVTVTEDVPEGMQVDSIIVVFSTPTGPILPVTKLTGTNSASVDVSPELGAAVKFYNSMVPPPPPPPPPPTGTEGCTPGYWKQTQHFDSWVGYSPTDSYAAVFGVDRQGTLLDALNSGGGGVAALMRHSVAALLNASSADVGYPATTAGVITAVQNAFASGDIEAQKNVFEGWNELGCGLN